MLSSKKKTFLGIASKLPASIGMVNLPKDLDHYVETL